MQTKNKIEEIAEEKLSLYFKGTPLYILKGINEKQIQKIYGIAYNMYQAGAYKDAEEIFSFLCLMDSREVKNWLGLAGTRKMLEKYEAAIEAYSMVVLLDKQNTEVHFHIAECYLKLKKNKKALDALNYVIKNSPKKSIFYKKALLIVENRKK